MTTQTTDQQAPPSKMSPTDICSLWRARIDAAQNAAKKWKRRGEKISNIYRSQSPSMQATSEDDSPSDRPTFNIFWSNTETLAPATYSRRPKVEAYRRFHDEDPVARVAGQILERAIQYEIDCRQDFHLTMKQVVKDRLLPGMGQCWIRYEPSFKKQTVQDQDPTNPLKLVPREEEVISDEFTPVDYIYWKDIIISPARTWADVRWMGRELMFSRDALEKRFGDTFKKFGGDIRTIAYDYDPAQTGPDSRTQQDQSTTRDKRAIVYEIADKDSKQFLWFAKGATVPLDIVSDPHGLEDFWPCPRPLLATTTNDEILPVADYIYYQDQIRELNKVSSRINLLVGALRLIGVYDGSQQILATLLSGGMENKMVPVNAWAAFAEKGGLKGVMDFVPLDQVAKILEGLYRARDQLKQEVYEITGMADIVRGASQASETLGAQEIKAKFANLRLSSRQQQVAEFVTAVMRIKGELICRHYTEETILRISSAQELPEAVQYRKAVEAHQQATQAFQQAQMQGPQAGPDGQPAPPPQPPGPPPRDIVTEAVKLLKDERTRNYRIEVASDSMIELEEVDEQERRDRFMSTVSNFFNAMKNVTAVGPEMVPVALEMLKFVVRGFKTGRGLESSIEDAISKISQKLANPQPPQPPESIQVAQIKEQGANERAKLESDTKKEIEGMKMMQSEQERVAGERHEATMAAFQGMRDEWAADKEAQVAEQTQLREQQAAASSQAQDQQFQMLGQLIQQAMAPQEAEESKKLDSIAEGQQAILEAMSSLEQAVRAPRRRVPRYNAAGDIESVEDTLQE